MKKGRGRRARKSHRYKSTRSSHRKAVEAPRITRAYFPFTRFDNPTQGEFDMPAFDQETTHVKWNVGSDCSEVMFGEARRVALLTVSNDSFPMPVGRGYLHTHPQGGPFKWCKGLVDQGYRQVWIFSPTLHESLYKDLQGAHLPVVITDKELTMESAESIFRDIANRQLSNIMAAETPQVVYYYGIPSLPKASTPPLPVRRETRQNVLEKPSEPRSLSPKIRTWEEEIAGWLDSKGISYVRNIDRTVPVRNGKEVNFELDFELSGKVVLQPHYEGFRMEEFKDQCLGLRQRFPKYKVILISDQNQRHLEDKYIYKWVGYSPPGFGGLMVALRELGFDL